MKTELKNDLTTTLSKMSLEEVSEFIINLNIEEAKKLITDRLNKDTKNLKFHGNLKILKTLIENTDLKNGTWRISDNNLFTQLLLIGNNINFYKTGTILIQGDSRNINNIKNELNKALELYSKLYK